MENQIEKKFINPEINDKPEWKLIARYVKFFLESRTMGRRAHSWDHTLFTAKQSLEILDRYHKDQPASDDERFSVFIASLIHDIIQPDDIVNNELSEQMESEWNFNKSGSEYTEGVKALNYFVDELNRKSETLKTSDVQDKLLEMLNRNKDNILKIYTEKEAKNLNEWEKIGESSKVLTISDIRGNWNSDAIVKLAVAYTYIYGKDPSKKLDGDNLIDLLSTKVLNKLTVSPKNKEDNPAKSFYYDFFHNEKTVQEIKDISPETYKDFYESINQLEALKLEKGLLDDMPEIKDICKKNGIGIFGMVHFWHDFETKHHNSTSQEAYAEFVKFLSERKDVDSIIEKYNLTSDEADILKRLDIETTTIMNKIKSFQDDLTNAENYFDVKL